MWKERKELQKSEYLEDEKSFWDQIKSIFDNVLIAFLLKHKKK